MTDTIRTAFDAQSQYKRCIDELTQFPLDEVLQAVSNEYWERTRTLPQRCDEEHFAGLTVIAQWDLDKRFREIKEALVRTHKESVTRTFIDKNQIGSPIDTIRSRAHIQINNQPLYRCTTIDKLDQPHLDTITINYLEHLTDYSYVPLNTDNEMVNSLYGSSDESDPPKTIAADSPQILRKEMTHLLVPKGAKEALETQGFTNNEVEWGLVVMHFARTKDEEYRGIHSKFMDSIAKQLGRVKYGKVLEVLLKGTEKGAFIEWEDEGSYSQGAYCRQYRITQKYMERDAIRYTLSKPIDIHRHYTQNDTHNIICKALERTYPHLGLPTLEEVKARAIELHKSKVKMKEKKCVYAVQAHQKKKFYNRAKRRVLDYDIELYASFLDEGIAQPYTTECGRVMDSFTKMRKWIRKMVTIDGEPIIEVDYGALHPCLVWRILNGFASQEEADRYLKMLMGDIYIEIARYLYPDASETDLEEVYRPKVKKELLTYFNDKAGNQHHYKCHKFFIKNFPEMLERLQSGKFATSKGHAETSSILLMYEADLVGNVMGKLFHKGIHCLYAFDALWVGKSYANEVRIIMDECALDGGIPCKAKIG